MGSIIFSPQFFFVFFFFVGEDNPSPDSPSLIGGGNRIGAREGFGTGSPSLQEAEISDSNFPQKVKS